MFGKVTVSGILFGNSLYMVKKNTKYGENVPALF